MYEWRIKKGKITMLQRAKTDEEIIISRVNKMLEKLKQSTAIKVLVEVEKETKELKLLYGKEYVEEITRKYFKERNGNG